MLYSDDEKKKAFEYLYFDFVDSLTEINKLKDNLKSTETELKLKEEYISQNQEYKYDLDALKEVHNNLALKNVELKKTAKLWEEKCRSFCISSRNVNDCLSKQIPFDVQKVLGNDFDLKQQLELESRPKKFEAAILLYTFGYTIGDKVIFNKCLY